MGKYKKSYHKLFKAALSAALAAGTVVSVVPVQVGAEGEIVVPEVSNVKALMQNYDEVKGNVDHVGNPNANKPGKGNSNSGGSKKPKNYVLSLMHTNDTHANLDNIAKKMTAVNEVRAAKPNAQLIDAGDVFSGTLYFNEFKGQADLEFMNLMGYDIMTFGNHEFDLGSSEEGHKALADFIKGAKFSFVSANADFSKDTNLQGLFSDLISSKPEDGKIYNGVVKEVDGQKIGFFGLTTPETKNISSPGEVIFENYIEEAKKAVKAFEKMGVNKIVAVTHIGYDDNASVDNDQELAKHVDGIDVIVGGHSHTQLDEPVVVTKDKKGKKKDPTVIVQAYQYNNFLGTLDVEFDKKGKVIGQAGELIKISDKVEDPETAILLETYSSQIEELKNEQIGATAVEALKNPRISDEGNTTGESVRKNETALGNLITDGMLAKAKEYESDVIMALQNGGGIRAAIDEGPITVGEVITVLPFGNTLATMKLTGAEIKEAFEISLRNLPNENGGFLHVSGGKVEFDSSQPMGERVIYVSYKNTDGTYTEIQDSETYTIATNAFTAKGGDGFTVFAKAYEEGRVADLGLSDWGNFAEHLRNLGSILPKVEGRIIDNAGTSESPVNVKLSVLSDIHYYDPSLGTTGDALSLYLQNDRKLLVESSAIIHSAVETIKNNDSEIVLISGDLTKDGELVSHEAVVEILRELEAAGKIVYVTHGNHDILNPKAVRFDGDTTTPVDYIDAEEFKDLYDEFGYSEAIAQDPNSLSYVVQPSEGLRIIVMDSVLYDMNIADDYPKTEGAFSEGRLQWILEQIEDAKANNQQIIGMTHHGVVEHFGVQDEIFPQYVIADWENVSDQLADAGMNVVFTGHFHAQDAVSKTTEAGNTIYDIETGSLVTFPSPYREVVISEDKISIDTITVDEIDFDTNGESFPDYARSFLENGMKTLVPMTLAQMIAEQNGISFEEALSQAQGLTAMQLAPEVDPSITVGSLVSDALIQHYSGDEELDPMTNGILQGMISNEDEMVQFLGNAILSILDDSSSDNELIIELN